MEDIPHVVEDIPHVVEDIPHVVEDIPHVVEDIPHVVEDIPHVVEDILYFGRDIPRLMPDIPDNMEDTPNVVQEFPNVVENRHSVATDGHRSAASLPDLVSGTIRGGVVRRFLIFHLALAGWRNHHAETFLEMSTRRLTSLAAALVVALPLLPARAADDTAIMPLADIKPGMLGEWHTTVSGSRVDSFPMQVVGIAENFIGPQRPVIICKALDATNRLTGPVAGMSGSPVFIGGKLIGAYAYGFLWPKDQALIGVTPIESMLEVENNYPPAEHLAGTNGMARIESGGNPEWLVAPASDAANLPALPALQSAMKPLPTPLFVSGISDRVLQKFSSRLAALGLDVMQAPSGRASHDIDNDPKPGQPLAGVLMSGDFHLAGTGTVTWRKGNRILAFGHPFMQAGPSDMPMASAEIMTIVQSVARSFKLSNTGPIIGTIYQDRLTAIAGEIGRKPNTTHFEVHLEAPGGKTRFFQGELFQNQNMSPIISAISLLESIYDIMETADQQTLYLDTEMDIAGHAPVKLSDAAGEGDAGYELVINHLMRYESLLENPCEFPDVKSLTFRVRMADGWKSARLDSLDLDQNEIKPGDTLHAVIGVKNYRGAAAAVPISVPVPADLRAPEVQLFVGDADAALQMDEPPQTPPQTLDQVLDRLRLARSHQNVCVKLLQSTPGLSVEGKNLPDLPPSVAAQFASPNSNTEKATLNRITLWETNFPVEGTFSGQITLPVRIK